MSISNLFTPNQYTIYCDEVVQANDSGLVTYNNLCLYTGSGPYTLQRAGLSLQYQVYGDLMVMSLTAGGGFFNLTGGPFNSIKFGPYNTLTNTPIEWNIGYRFDTGDEDLNVPVSINCGTSNARNLVAQLSVNSNTDNVDGKLSMTLYPLSADNGVSQGSFSPSGATFALYIFSFTVKVVKV
jgi:hypothetical protein